MESYEEIVNRMKNRRNTSEVIKEQTEPDTENKKRKWKLINRFLAVICLVLAFLIYANKDPNADFINKIFNTNINFTKLNTSIGNFTKTLTNFFNFTKTDDGKEVIEVSQKSKFLKVGDHLYTNDNSLAYSVDDGTIISVNQIDDYYQVIIRFDNGYTGIYEKLIDSDLTIYDRINYDDVIGVFNGDFRFYLTYNKQIYSYEDLVQD